MNNGDIIDHEHGTRLGDPDLIEAICDGLVITEAEWNAMDQEEQHAQQLAWVSPMPDFELIDRQYYGHA